MRQSEKEQTLIVKGSRKKRMSISLVIGKGIEKVTAKCKQELEDWKLS